MQTVTSAENGGTDTADFQVHIQLYKSVLYGTNIINLTEDNIHELQNIENSVYMSILGVTHYSPNVTLGKK